MRPIPTRTASTGRLRAKLANRAHPRGITRFSLGQVGHHHYQNPEGEQYPEPKRRSNQQTSVHLLPSPLLNMRSESATIAAAAGNFKLRQ
jgi:hypothetical protein